MAASQESSTGRRLIGRFATIVLAAATAIGAGPTTLGLVLADSPTVALAAASTPTTGWTWKAAGDEQGGGGDSAGSDSGGDSGGDTNVSGNPDGGDSDSGDSGSGGAPDVEGKGSDKSDSDGGGEKGPDVEAGAKDTTAEDGGESGSAVGTDPEKREPAGESGEDTTTVDGRPDNSENDASGNTEIHRMSAAPEGDEDGQSTLQEYSGLIEDSTSTSNTQVAGPPTAQDPDGTTTSIDPARGILNAQQDRASYAARSILDPRTDGQEQEVDSPLRTVLGPDVPKSGTSGQDLRPLKKNPNEWDMVPEWKDYKYGGIGAGLAVAERSYTDAYKIDKKSADGFTKRAQKAQNTLVKAQADLRTYERLSARGISDPTMRAYYRSRVDSAASDVAHQQKLLDAMSAPKQGLDRLAGTPSTAPPGAQAADAAADLGPNGEKIGTKIPDANLAAGATAVDAAEELAPKPSVLGKGVGVLARGVGKAAPGLGLLATGFQAKEDLDAGKSEGRVAWESGGSIAGGMAGGALGGAIGSFLLPGVGTAAGVAVGNAVGSFLGGKAGDLLADRFMGEGK